MNQEELKIFKISTESFYAEIGKTKDREKVQDTMTQLIMRYNLTNKKVLSVGPGSADEEYWFYKNGCSLFFVDIDEHKKIEKTLSTLQQDSNPLTYLIGDARKIQDHITEKFAVCYFSGFTPDELRREIIIQEHIKANTDAMYPSWPKDEKPYSELIESIINKNLAYGGLFISQSYYGGIDMASNPHVVSLMREQLLEMNIHLLAVYFFESWPGVSLVVGVKARNARALYYGKKINANADISSFHGRAKIDSPIVKAYDFLEEYKKKSIGDKIKQWISI